MPGVLFDMAKRFIDTSKYRADWRAVPASTRLTFYWLWENCDAAGVWEMDPDYFKFQTSIKWDIEAVLKHLSGSVVKISATAVWLTDFIEVNYGVLKEGYNPHKPAIRSVARYGLDVPTHGAHMLGKVPGNRSRITQKVRDAIMMRDSMTCQYCSAHLEREMLVIDHFVPVTKGGDSSDDNLLTACVRCNTKKHISLPNEFAQAGHPFYKPSELVISKLDQFLIKLDKNLFKLEDEGEDEDNSGKKEHASVRPPTPPEPIIEPAAVPLPFASEEFALSWAEWEASRRKRGKPISEDARKMQLTKCMEWGEERAIAALKHSRTNDYQGLYEPNNRANHGPASKTIDATNAQIERVSRMLAATRQ